jgi:LPS export ABC transporter protein LptC
MFFMKVKKIFTTISILLLFTAVIYGGYLLLRGTDVVVPSLIQPAPGPRLLMSMDGFRFAQSNEGRVVWRMLAKNADLYGNKEAQLKEIEITFNNPNEKNAKLFGATGTMDTATGNASIHRGAKEVRIKTSDGYLLTTNSLFWKAGERLVWTEEPFKMLGNEIYLEGVGISANVDLHSVVVKNNVKAVLQE